MVIIVNHSLQYNAAMKLLATMDFDTDEQTFGAILFMAALCGEKDAANIDDALVSFK